MPKKVINTHKIICTSPGTHRQFESIHYQTNIDGPKVYIQAGIHADEIPGILTIQHLKEKLDFLFTENLLTGEIILVPFANPIGLAQFIKGKHIGRFDLDMTGNFNRDYFDLATACIDDIIPMLGDDIDKNTQLIRKSFIKKLNQYQPQIETDDLKKQLLLLACNSDYVFDLHCDTQSILHIYANQVHQTQAKTLAKYLESPILLLEDDPGGFAFDEAVASPWWRIRSELQKRNIDKPIDNACFASTIELRGQLDVCDSTSQKDADRLLQFLTHIKVIDKTPAPIPNNIKLQQSQLQAVDTITAPHGGIVIFKKKLGEAISKGEHIADLISIDAAGKRTKLVSQTDGILFTLIDHHLVRSGYTIAKVVGSKTLGYRQGALLAF